MNIMCSQIGSLLKNKCGKSFPIAMLVNDFLSFTYLYNYKMLPLEKKSLSFHLVCNEETNAKRSEPLGLRSLSPQIVQLGINLRVPKTRVWSFSLPTTPQICSLYVTAGYTLILEIKWATFTFQCLLYKNKNDPSFNNLSMFKNTHTLGC